MLDSVFSDRRLQTIPASLFSHSSLLGWPHAVRDP